MSLAPGNLRRPSGSLLKAISGNGLRSDTPAVPASGAYDRGHVAASLDRRTRHCPDALSWSASSLLLTLAGRWLALAPAQILAPYVPTPEDVVDRMLALAGTTKDDVVYDLGCGDGRIPIAAAKSYGARGVGLDIDPEADRRVAGERQGRRRRASRRVPLEDVLTADVSHATVVTLYLLASGNAKLRPILTRQLRPGARIVSHAFSMGAELARRQGRPLHQRAGGRGDALFVEGGREDQAVRPARHSALSRRRRTAPCARSTISPTSCV